jgi:hypothetical protein
MKPLTLALLLTLIGCEDTPPTLEEKFANKCLEKNNGFYCTMASVKYSQLQDFGVNGLYVNKKRELDEKGCELNNAISCRLASQDETRRESMRLEYRAKGCKLSITNIKPKGYDEALSVEPDAGVMNLYQDEFINCARLKPSDFGASESISFDSGSLDILEVVQALKEKCISDNYMKDTYCSSLRYSFGYYLSKDDKVRKTKAFKETKPFY